MLIAGARGVMEVTAVHVKVVSKRFRSADFLVLLFKLMQYLTVTLFQKCSSLVQYRNY